jgi:hypothetical protein
VEKIRIDMEAPHLAHLAEALDTNPDAARVAVPVPPSPAIGRGGSAPALNPAPARGYADDVEPVAAARSADAVELGDDEEPYGADSYGADSSGADSSGADSYGGTEVPAREVPANGADANGADANGAGRYWRSLGGGKAGPDRPEPVPAVHPTGARQDPGPDPGRPDGDEIDLLDDLDELEELDYSRGARGEGHR